MPGLTSKYGTNIISVIVAALQFAEVTTYRDLAELTQEDFANALAPAFRAEGHSVPAKQMVVKVLRAMHDEPRVRRARANRVLEGPQ